MKRLKLSESGVGQLQAAVTQLQASTEKREAIELKLRHKLEDELRQLKQQRVSHVTNSRTNCASSSNSG